MKSAKCLILILALFTVLLVTSVFFIQYRLYNVFESRNKLILISMDGFKHNYIEQVKKYGGKTPNFDYLISKGSRIMRMKNAFPTITLPNHQTLVTGLYPENHGIVLNTFIDNKRPNERFDMNNQDNLNDKSWFENWPVPIWVTLQKSGIYTASHLWPLVDAPIDGELPVYQESQYTLLDNSIVFPFQRRCDDMARWLSDSHVKKPIDFGLLYFPEPDETGHYYGPNSKQIRNKVMELDAVIGRLLQQLKSRGLENKVNIIVTADHGMSEISNTREIALDDYVDSSWYSATLLTPIAALYPAKGKEQDLYNGLKNKNPHLEVYWRQEVPASLNYSRDNGRIAPLIGIAENGWSIVHKHSTSKYTAGNHGYNNSVPDVQPFFIAYGPDFKQNYTMPMGYSVDVYSLMCYLMGIKPNKNDGDFNRIKSILSNTQKSLVDFIRLANDIKPWMLYTIVGVGFSIQLIILILFILFCRAHYKRRQNLSLNTDFEYNKLPKQLN